MFTYRKLTFMLTSFIVIFSFIFLGAFPSSLVQAESFASPRHGSPDFVWVTCAAQTQIPTEECDALVALYNSTNGANWTNNTGWLQSNTPCSWFGISCANGTNVTRLILAKNNLIGAIPPELGNLSKLTKLDLSFNQLSGTIPSQLGSLTNLTDLILIATQLNGSIPAQLGNLTNLTLLWLSDNYLSGSIPSELGNLTNLTYLYLDSNYLSGSIPTQLGNLTKLEWLYLQDNYLSGSVPIQLGDLTQLEWLWLSDNYLSGSIPEDLGNLTNLRGLYLQGNQFSGEFPASITNLINLVAFTFDCRITSNDPIVTAFIDVRSPGWQNKICPVVVSITRGNPNPTSLSSVNFIVVFSKPVTGVDITDFSLGVTNVIGASITNVSGSGTTYTITINTGSGNGLIVLTVMDDDSITDMANIPLGGTGLWNGNFAFGGTYTTLHGGDTTGVFRPSNGLLYLKNFNITGLADVAINYGLGGDYPVVGDWDGNGTDTIGIYRNGSFYLRNSNTLGFADRVFAFGQPNDQPVAGDWNGDGTDTIGVYRPSTGQFLLRDSNSAGVADHSFYLGNVGDVGIAGDWTGKGFDTVGVFRPTNGIIFLKNTNQTGFADIALNYGLPGDQPVVGDWNVDGIDTIGVYRNGQFLLRNSNTVGFADISFYLGNSGDVPIAGNWDGLSYNPYLQNLIEKAQEDLAKRLSIPINQIGPVEATEVEWSDTSLGCPKPGGIYLFVLVPGYLILLNAGNIEYQYHTDLIAHFIYCGIYYP